MTTPNSIAGAKPLGSATSHQSVSSTVKGKTHITHKQGGRARINAELVLDEFRQEGGEPRDEETLAGSREVQEEEGRIGDEATQRSRQLPDLGERLSVTVSVGLRHFLRLQRRSPSTHRIL